MRKWILGGVFALLIVFYVIGRNSPPPQAQAKATASTNSTVKEARAVPVDTVVTKEIAPALDNWSVSKASRSEFDDSASASISTTASESVEGWLKTFTPILYVRCSENQSEVFVHVGMPATVEYGEYNRHTVRIRVDEKPARNLKASQSTNGEALFLGGASLAKSFFGGKRLVFGFTPFNANPVVATFDISGIEEAIKPVREACNW